MAKKNSLSAEDWIKAAFRALSVGGEQAIRAEAIARDLKVSKGSFYWHFKDVPDLKSAMLTLWVERATSETIALTDANQSGPIERLEHLTVIATDDRSSEFGGRRAEMAIRNWALFDDDVAEILKKVEQVRVTYVAELFVAVGAKRPRANLFARLYYGNLIGLEQLANTQDVDVRADLQAHLKLILTALLDEQEQQSAAREDFGIQ